MKIGLIGFGFMGGVHLAALEEIGHAQVVALATRTRPTADGPARGNLEHVKTVTLPEHVRWCSDWRELLADPEIDAVDICLPTHLHREVVLRAFEAGKHVFCEKPMALTAADCDGMLEAAQRSDRTFMVGQVLRFMFPYRYAAEFVHEKCGRKVESCTMYRRTGYPQWSAWLSQEQQSGGAILDLLSHDIDQALKLFGWPRAVRATSAGEVDTMLGVLHYADGLQVKIEGGWLTPEVPFSAGFRMKGSAGELVLEGGKLTLEQGDGVQAIEQPEDHAYRDELAYFVACCEQKQTPELCLPVESADAVRIANLLKRSREQNGKEVLC